MSSLRTATPGEFEAYLANPGRMVCRRVNAYETAVEWEGGEIVAIGASCMRFLVPSRADFMIPWELVPLGAAPDGVYLFRRGRLIEFCGGMFDGMPQRLDAS